MQDKELMILPLVSGIVAIAVAASFFFGFGIEVEHLAQKDPAALVPAFLMYVAVYAVGIFFQAAVVAGATERMRGGDPTIASALAAAWRRAGAILIWAVVAATVGILLRALRDKAGFVGKIAVAILGAAWSLATFFIVPVIVLEDRPIGDSFKHSVRTFKETWGETFIGGVTLGIAVFACWATLVAAVGMLAWLAQPILAVIVAVVGAITLLVFFSALQGVYVASLYRYATAGTVDGFDRDVLANAFVPKRR
jgi:hypothetical protein